MAMEIRCSSATARDWTGEALVVGLFSDAPGEGSRELLKSRFGEALLARMERRRFKAKPGESLVVELLDQQPSTLVLVGLGAAADFNLEQLRHAAAMGAKAANGSGASSLGLALPGCSPRTAVESLAAARPDATFAPSLWYEIDGTGATHLFITKAEMGQHVGTALARIVAEELGAAWSQVRITHVDSHPKWGAMVTGGSWSVHTSFKALSQAGAAGRQLLQAAGAAHLGVAVEACTVADGEVCAGGKSVNFGTLVSAGLPEAELSAE
ncbi:MAG: hypothetical protein EBW30_07260, partial [Synechococcaceae bacterium WB7_3xG_012]|nr:hypothetical protein [Synechococcaceae bacterium WB7_3xG_012]